MLQGSDRLTTTLVCDIHSGHVTDILLMYLLD